MAKHEKQFANRIGTNARQGLENHPYSIFRKLIDRDNYCGSQMSFSLFLYNIRHKLPNDNRYKSAVNRLIVSLIPGHAMDEGV